MAGYVLPENISELPFAYATKDRKTVIKTVRVWEEKDLDLLLKELENYFQELDVARTEEYWRGVGVLYCIAKLSELRPGAELNWKIRKLINHRKKNNLY